MLLIFYEHMKLDMPHPHQVSGHIYIYVDRICVCIVTFFKILWHLSCMKLLFLCDIIFWHFWCTSVMSKKWNIPFMFFCRIMKPTVTMRIGHHSTWYTKGQSWPHIKNWLC